MVLSRRARLPLSSSSILARAPALALAVACALSERAASAQEPMPPLPPPPAAAPTPIDAPAVPPPPAVPEPAPPPPLPPAIAPPREPPPILLETTAPGERPDDVRFTDANADRVILGSTAETHPAGTFFVSDYDIGLLQLGYAVTDSFQLSISGVPPIFQNQPYFVDLGVKLNVLRTDAFRAAVTGAVEVVTAGGSNGSSNIVYPGGRVAAIGQFCFNVTCRSSVSLNAGAFFSGGFNNEVPVYGSAGVIANVSSLVSLLAEPALVGTANAGTNGDTLFAVDYGVRLSGKNFGVDLTFVEPLAVTSGSFSNPLLFGIPFVAFTYRTDGTARPGSMGASNVASSAALLTSAPR